MKHTEALRYSRWEQFVFRVTGRWPRSVAERRLLASSLDLAEWRLRNALVAVEAGATHARHGIKEIEQEMQGDEAERRLRGKLAAVEEDIRLRQEYRKNRRAR